MKISLFFAQPLSVYFAKIRNCRISKYLWKEIVRFIRTKIKLLMENCSFSYQYFLTHFHPRSFFNTFLTEHISRKETYCILPDTSLRHKNNFLNSLILYWGGHQFMISTETPSLKHLSSVALRKLQV